MIPILILLIILLVLACVKCKKENFDTLFDIKGEKNSISRYMSRGLMLFLVFFVLSINFFGLSLALQCNKDKNFVSRFFIGIFAFMFSFIYIIFSYYMFRVKKGDSCDICSNNPFPLF